MNNLLNKLYPHLLILLGFLVISVIYCYPMLEGKRLIQHDVIQSEAAAHQLAEYRKEKGELSLWANTMFSGMPAFMVYMDYPLSLTTKVGRLIVNLLPQPANFIFLYMLGFYLMMVILGYNTWIAVLGALAYSLASYNIINIEAGHISKVIALAFAPPFIAAVMMTYKGNFLLGAALSGFFAGIQLYANHVQITYYILIALLLYVVLEFVQVILDKQDRTRLGTFFTASAVLLLAGGLAVGSHASRLLTTYEYSTQTIRGKSELTSNKQSTGGLDRDYAFQWSYGKLETMTFLIPDFYGGGSGGSLGESSETYKTLTSKGVPPDGAKSFVQQLPLYWGNQPFTSGPAYLGAIVCFLFVFSLWISRNPLKWWLLSVTILFTLLAWGKNLAWFNNFFFDYVPMYNKFRAVTMILSLVQLFVVWMVILGLKEFFEKDFNKEKTLKPLLYSVLLVGGIVLFFGLFAGSMLDFKTTDIVNDSVNEQGKAVKITRDDQFKASLVQMVGGDAGFANQIFGAILYDRVGLLRSDALRSLVFILLTAGLIWAYLKNRLQLTYFLGILTFLVLVDMWAVAKRYLNATDFKKRSEYTGNFERSEADRKILEDKDINYRVIDFSSGVFQDAKPSYHHQSVGGYSAVKLRRYQELIDAHLSKNNLPVYNMLNTKYFIIPGRTGDLVAQQNPDVLGNVWFVEEYKIVKNADAEIKALEKFNPAKTVFIDKRFEKQLNKLKIKADSTATIKLTSYKPNELLYESNTKSLQLAVFSEIYYVSEGQTEWKAYIDDKAVPLLRANYVLRALVIPAGKHTIRFTFESPLYRRGEVVALICSIILLGGLIVAAYFSYQKEGKKN